MQLDTGDVFYPRWRSHWITTAVLDKTVNVSLIDDNGQNAAMGKDDGKADAKVPFGVVGTVMPKTGDGSSSYDYGNTDDGWTRNW